MPCEGTTCNSLRNADEDDDDDDDDEWPKDRGNGKDRRIRKVDEACDVRFSCRGCDTCACTGATGYGPNCACRAWSADFVLGSTSMEFSTKVGGVRGEKDASVEVGEPDG